MMRSWGLICLLLAAGPPAHQRNDGAITVLGTEFRADAKERQAHVDGKVLGMADIKIIRVRIISVGQRVEIGLQDVVAVPIG